MNYVAMLCCVKRPASMSGVLGITGCLLSIPRIFMDFVHQQYHNLYSFTNAHIYIYIKYCTCCWISCKNSMRVH